MSEKPLGRKAYGSIGHLPQSRTGPGDHSVPEGQARIATVAARDRHDEIFVQEKLDGSCVAVAKVRGELIPLGRAGYPAVSSPYKQHRYFHLWVLQQWERFYDLLDEGERIVGEWLAQAHGTRYELGHEPFVAFDLMVGAERLPYDHFDRRVRNVFVQPQLIHRGGPLSVEKAMGKLNPGGYYGFHGALEPVEGAVWRVERNVLTSRAGGERTRTVDFLTKYVRPDKEDGKYLPDVSGKEAVWNWTYE